MPRDGSNIYSQPFPDVVEDTTVESTVYNGFTNDVAADLNAPRPVVAGGTGATSADQALFNLAAEKAAQIVTNYDSHLWVPGSFRSATTATGAPVADHAFAGVCYISEALANPPTNQNVVVEAIDTTDPTNIVKYIRVKTAGVWSLWSGVSSGSAAASIGEYTFDTGITFPPGSGQVRLNNATQNSATEIFISHTTALGSDNTNLIPFAIKSGSDIAIQDKDEISKYKIFTATANPVLSGGDYRVTVMFKSGGTDIVTAQRVLVGATDGGVVRYDAAQTLTSTQQAQARANIAVTKKNYIINGAMMVSQENGTTVGGTSLYYPADQFFIQFSHGGTVGHAQVAVSTPGGSPNRIRIGPSVLDTAVAAGDFLLIQQNVEGLRVADLMFGTASAKTLTIQFGVRAPAGTYCVCVYNGAANRFYTTEYVIAAGEANTDVVKSVTLTGDITGTWAKDNTPGLHVRWMLMAGSSLYGAPNTWTGSPVVSTSNQYNLMGTAGNVFELFDVSLTEGTVAPPFQVPDYASELAACQRYFQKVGPNAANGFLANGQAITTARAIFGLIYPGGEMRAAPSLGVNANLVVWAANSTGLTPASGPLLFGNPSVSRTLLDVTTTTAGLVAGNSTMLVTLDVTGRILLNARL